MRTHPHRYDPKRRLGIARRRSKTPLGRKRRIARAADRRARQHFDAGQRLAGLGAFETGPAAYSPTYQNPGASTSPNTLRLRRWKPKPSKAKRRMKARPAHPSYRARPEGERRLSRREKRAVKRARTEARRAEL